MLTATRIIPIVPVHSIPQALPFYRDQVGLDEQERGPDGSVVLATGQGAALELRELPDVTASEHTVATFEVDDLEDALQDLESRGVRFEDYDLPDIHTENHIATMGSHRAAWFRDTDGNILCLHETQS